MSNWMRAVGQDAVAAQAATTSAQLPMYHGASLGISSPYVISPEASTIRINISFWYEIACSYCNMHIEDCYTKVAHNATFQRDDWAALAGFDTPELEELLWGGPGSSDTAVLRHSSSFRSTWSRPTTSCTFSQIWKVGMGHQHQGGARGSYCKPATEPGTDMQ